jgi:hypothetical protein
MENQFLAPKLKITETSERPGKYGIITLNHLNKYEIKTSIGTSLE